MTEIPTCANCGHHRSFHRESGGLTFCFALVKRVPQELCDCRDFHPDVMLSVTPETKELIRKVERGDFDI
jgi:hypothetical protein